MDMYTPMRFAFSIQFKSTHAYICTLLPAAVVKRTRPATFLQKNVSKRRKNVLMEVEELLEHIFFYRRTWAAMEDVR